MWPFRKKANQPQCNPVRTKVVIEIPDALEPMQADRKYVDPMRQLLADNHAGVITVVSQGDPNTPDEFTRIIVVELCDLELGLALLGDFLTDQGAPAGTLTRVYGADGNMVDLYILTP